MADDGAIVAQTGVDELFVETAGPVFAYCYARVGSRNLAEWAVTATFDRAQAALRNGGIPNPKLDWLLRTADKFCAPNLRLDAEAVGVESLVVLQDWRGRSFDEIENELRARQARLEEERNRLTPWRKLLGAFNLGPAASWAKGLFAGASAVKASIAAVAVVGAIAVVATPVATKLHHAVRPSGHEPAPASAPVTPTGGATPSAPTGAAKPAVPASAAVAASAGGDRHGVGSSAGVTTTGSAPKAPVQSGGSQPASTSGSSGPSRPSADSGARPGSGAAAIADTVGPTLPTPKPAGSSPAGPSVTTKVATTPAVTTPKVATPEPPTVSTPTVPASPEVPTVPSVSTPTATAPSVSTPSAPSVTVPSPPSPPTVSSGSAPSTPSVSTPSVPPPPPAPSVTAPTVTLPGH